MSNRGKFFERLMSGTSDRTVDFGQLCELLRWLGFTERVRGSHHVFTMAGVEELIDLQPEGRHGKTYQVRQVRDILKAHSMEVE